MLYNNMPNPHFASWVVLCIFLFCATPKFMVCHGFQISSEPISSSTSYRTRQCQKIQAWAKPSPKASFDLDAIEAFESQLEQLEQQKQQVEEGKLDSNLENGIDDDDDDDLDDELTANTSFILVVPPELHNKRIDAAIAALMDPELSRSTCGNLVTDGRVQKLSENNANEQLHDDDNNKNINLKEEGEVIDRKSFKVEAEMILKVSLPQEESPTEIVAQDLPLDILFEDEHMIVLNKAAHMVVHPAAGNWDGTVVNALAYYLPRSSYGRGDFVDIDGKPVIVSAASASTDGDDDNNNQQQDALQGQSIDESTTLSFRPGIVHRLDKGTTGVLVVAKTSRALTALSEAFADRRVKKTYLAVTVGNPGRNVKIDKPIGRHPIHRQRMRVVPDPHQRNSKNRLVPPSKVQIESRAASVAGRRALSYVDTLAFDGKLGLVRVKIETGRTHQIRVHLQDRHTPVYGDPVYGLSDWNKRLSKTHQIDRTLLHAYKLSLHHPITGEPMEFTAPLDPEMMKIAETIVPPDEELNDLLSW